MRFTVSLAVFCFIGISWTIAEDAEQVLFIAGGGYSEDYGSRDTQAIHLATGEGGYECRKPETIPSLEFWSTPSFKINGLPVICAYSGRCMKHMGREGNYWSDDLNIYPVAVQLDEERAWLAGGYNQDNYEDDFLSTLIYTQDGLLPGPELPAEFNSHCIAKIDDDRYIFAGGYPGMDGYNMKTYVYTWSTETWGIGPDIPVSRDNAACGVIESANGKEFVITGGYGRGPSPGNATYSVQHLTTDILNLETYEWRQGPPLNAFRISATSVPYGNTFLVAGGVEYFDDHYLGPTGHSTILEYVPRVDAWIERPERLTLPKADFHATIVDYDVIPCEPL